METNRAAPETLVEAIRRFADSESCLPFLAELRWPNGVTCPHCGSQDVTVLADYRRWTCRQDHPRRQFSIKTGTIFEDSPLGLDRWLPALWRVVNCKNGVNSYEVAQAFRTFLDDSDMPAYLAILKMLMDAVSDVKHGRNGIVWRYAGGGIPKKDVPRQPSSLPTIA